ncbi:MAG: hypothetical protein Q4B50_07965 [Bacillota bacterium]|nr:hypothetical protein [Bacillota bacterium]
MMNYILADYRRILLRIPRLIFVGLFEIVLAFIVLHKWSGAGANYSSVDFISSMDVWLFTLGPIILGVVTLVNVFSDDFKSKTMQVAIGVGVTRFQVVAGKLIQSFLIFLTDIVLTCVLVTVLSMIVGVQLVPQQIYHLFVEFLYFLLWNTCWIGIVSILVFKLQGMLLPMLLYIFLNFSVVESLFRWITRSGPELLSRLHLERYTLEYLLELFRSNLLMERFNIGAVIGILIYLGLSLYATYLVFRKQELDF